MSVRHAGTPDADRCLVAYAVGRHAGTAVVRNRIRRRLRAALAELAAADGLPAGAVVISAGTPVATAPFPTVRADLRRALDRAAGA